VIRGYVGKSIESGTPNDRRKEVGAADPSAAIRNPNAPPETRRVGAR
jgi:hypothetical protein